jgi:1,4-alpha-glucan branching enzyme
MKKVLNFLAAGLLFFGFNCNAQIVTTSPSPLQESSENVVLTYHADAAAGNNGLKGLSASTAVYAHIGVITNLSTSSSDWKYTVTSWPTSASDTKANTDKNKLTYVSANTYTLNIGDIRSYFGITNSAEKVKQIALVFRTADGKKEGKTSSGGDIFVDVLDEGFVMDFTSDATSNVITKATTINFTVTTSSTATLDISVNGSSIGSATNATTLTKGYNFSQKGSYSVVATANNGTTTLTETINITYPNTSEAQNYPGGVPKQGAVRNSDGTVTFCLAAPNKSTVVLVPSWDNYEVLDKNVMKYQDYNGNRYFWTTVSGLDNHTSYPYYYYVDMTYKVADPYANLVLDCYNDKWIDSTIWPDMPAYPYDKFSDIMLAVYRGDLDSYKWSDFTIPSHDQLVIYELLFRDFTGTEGKASANGTVRRAIEKIPYLKALGVNAVELMPIMEFNGNNSWGYNTNFYMAPDKAYGSPLDYKEFIDLCHQNGMAVILDIVFNQSDGLHPWYQLYPIASNPFYNKTAPHDYSVLNDWNQDNALVQQQWDDAIKFWMTEYNVDGFRFDLVKGLGDNSSYGSGTEVYNQSRVDRMTRLHKVITSVKANGIHINENLAGAQEEIAMGNDGQLQWANVNYNSCQYTMGYDSSSSLTRFLSSLDSSRPWGSTVAYAESHDEERMGYKINQWGATNVKGNTANSCKRLGSLAVQMLMTPGPKMIWQFGELGADQTTKTADSSSNSTDPKTVIWSRLDDDNYSGLHQTYLDLCNLRKDNPDMFSQDATFVTSGLSSALTTPRTMRLTKGNKEIVAFINASISNTINVSTTPTLLSTSNYQLISATSGTTPKLTGTGSSVCVSLPAHSYAVFATTNVAGVENVMVDNAAEVGVSNGQIVISGDYRHAEVYNLAGVRQADGQLTPGLYIVNVDGHVSKVIVK